VETLLHEPSTEPGLPPWEQADLPAAPRFHVSHWTRLIGPGLLMAGANIGGGEWLFGPLVTAQYGGRVLWLASLAILLQVGYNLCVMRYALYTGESILIAFLRTRPGLRFWAIAYLVMDLGSLWPYLAANAAVPLAAVILGRLPGAGDSGLVHGLGNAIFLAAFVPLIFGGKIYNSIQRVMVTKLVLILSYLGFLALFFTGWDTKWEIASGFYRFGALPEGEFNWATLAAFAAISGAGGLSNIAFSNFVRDKGWGMGALVGALPSAIGGKHIKLSHNGKIFALTQENLREWKVWLGHLRRDQLALWAPACILGMALPAAISYEFIRGVQDVEGNAVAAMTAQAISDSHGPIFWFLTLLCGFAILFPTQISNVDGISRRWTDVLWMGMKRLRRVPERNVKYVYYGLIVLYLIWGLIMLRVAPNPLVIAVASGVMLNFAMGFSALHVLYVNMTLLPAELRPGWLLRIGLVACSVFYITISTIALKQQWPNIAAYLWGA
jgi:hypothetical protein